MKEVVRNDRNDQEAKRQLKANNPLICVLPIVLSLQPKEFYEKKKKEFRDVFSFNP